MKIRWLLFAFSGVGKRGSALRQTRPRPPESLFQSGFAASRAVGA
jgi:hypothetical protein